MTERRTCRHIATGKPKFSRPTATIRLKSIVTSCEDESCDILFELCAMCAAFFHTALESSEERGTVPVPIDRINTSVLV